MSQSWKRKERAVGNHEQVETRGKGWTRTSTLMAIYVDSSWMRKVFDVLQQQQSLGLGGHLEIFEVRDYRQITSASAPETMTYSLSTVPIDKTLLFLNEA